MRTFEEIFAIAAERKDDFDALVSSRDVPKSATELAGLADDR